MRCVLHIMPRPPGSDKPMVDQGVVVINDLDCAVVLFGSIINNAETFIDPPKQPEVRRYRSSAPATGVHVPSDHTITGR